MFRRRSPKAPGAPPHQAYDPILLDVPEKGIIVALAQRAGSTSMLTALGDMRKRTIYPEVALRKRDREGVPIVMWLRDPFERLASALNMINRIQRPRRIGIQYRDVPMRFILERDNIHWKPQLELHREQGILIPNKFYAFEDLGDTWVKELPGFALGRKNETRGIKRTWAEYEETLTPKEMAQLRAFYKADINERARIVRPVPKGKAKGVS